MIYWVIEQKNLNLVAKVKFVKMSTSQKKVQCISWFIETKSDVQAQQNFRRKYGKEWPTRSTIQSWHKKFLEIGKMVFHQDNATPRWVVKCGNFWTKRFQIEELNVMVPSLSASLPQRYTIGLLLVGLCKKYSVPNQSLRQH